MNNEKMNQIIDEAYENYLKECENLSPKVLLSDMQAFYKGPITLGPQDPRKIASPYLIKEFINKCKTDTEFSEKWGLKIEERELSDDERFRIAYKVLELRKVLESESKMLHYPDGHNKVMDDANIPTKLITVTYNDIKTEIYE